MTMNIIEDALRGHEIISHLTNGSEPLKGIKINEIADDCVTVTADGSNVVCMHGKDRLEVKDSPLDQTVNTILEASKGYELWERDLYHMIFNGCDLQEIVDKAEELFHNPVFIVDETDRVLAKTAHKEGEVNEAWDYILETGYMPYDAATTSLSKITSSEHSHSRRGKNIPFIFSPPTKDIDNRGINYRIFLPDSKVALGTLIIIENETPVTLGMLNLSQILADAVDEWLNMHKLEHPFKTGRDLVRDLIEDPERVERSEVLKRYLQTSEEGYKLAVITGCGHVPEEQIEKMIMDSLEGSLAYKLGEEVIVIIPLTNSEEEIRKHLDQLLYYQGARIGLSYPFYDLSALSGYYHQAQVALSYSGGKFAGIRPEIAMRYFTDETAKDLFGSNIAHPALEKLREYDERHGGALYLTLYQFLRHERSLIDSARALNIHRNSLIYRIEKIRQLTDVDLDDADMREYLLFSFRIMNDRS